jgi:hypothetical protein
MAHTSSSHTSAPGAAPLPAWQISYGNLPAAADPNAAGPWQRPPDWLPLPAIQSGEQKLVGLFAVYPGEGNVVAVRAAGNYTVNWGDGTIEQITSPGEQIRRHQEWFGNNFWGRLERFSICPLNDPRWIHRIDGTLSIYVGGERFPSSQYRIEENSSTGNVEVVLTPALSTNTYRYVYGSWSWGLPLVRSASETFYECTALRSLSLQEMRSLRDATYLVYGCYALRELRLTGVESLTGMEWVCEYAESLERVWIEGARRLRSTANLFYECSSLRQVVITGADSIKNMSGMFRYCRSLEVAPELNTSAAAVSGAAGGIDPLGQLGGCWRT